MKRQFTAGAKAKRELKVLRLHLKDVTAHATSIIGDYDKHVAYLRNVVIKGKNESIAAANKLNIDVNNRYYDLLADYKATVMRLENEQKQALQKFKEDRETLLEQVNFYKQLNRKLIEDQTTLNKQLADKNHKVKKSRENLFSLLFSLIISIIILLVW